jgi:hypothetical protein
MAKSPVLNVEGRVRKSTIKFAQALLDAGVKVTKVERLMNLDFIRIKGKGRFNLSVNVNYFNSCLTVSVFTRKGFVQSSGRYKTPNEFQALLKVWNIATY